MLQKICRPFIEIGLDDRRFASVHFLIYLVLGTIMLLSYTTVYAAAACDGGTNCYVGRFATGDASGKDWADLCAPLSTSNATTNCKIASMGRGWTYWIAASPSAAITGASESGTNATFTINNSAGTFASGQSVDIQGVTNFRYNFVCVVSSANTTSFTCPMPITNLKSGSESGTTVTMLLPVATSSVQTGWSPRVGESWTVSGSSVSGYNITATVGANGQTGSGCPTANPCNIYFTYTAGSGLGATTGGTAQLTGLASSSGGTATIRYPFTVLNTADSGNSTITLQSPTSTNHGTSTGWNPSTMLGVADLADPFRIASDYWVINGGACTFTSSNITTSRYFEFGCGIGIRYSGSQDFDDLELGSTSPTTTSGTTIKNLEIVGDGSLNDCDTTINVATNSGSLSGSGGNTITQVYMHNTGGGGVQNGGNGSLMMDQLYEAYPVDQASGAPGTPVCHAENINIVKSPFSGKVTLRYSILVNPVATAAIATASYSGSSPSGEIDIYGNYTFVDPNNVPAATAGAWLQLLGTSSSIATMNIFNNTQVGGNTFPCGIGGAASLSFTTVTIENNLDYNCQMNGATWGLGNVTTKTIDYNAYFKTTNTDTSANVQGGNSAGVNSNPLANYPTSNPYNGSLISPDPTNAGAVQTLFTVDMFGTAFNSSAWSRGCCAETGSGSPVASFSPPSVSCGSVNLTNTGTCPILTLTNTGTAALVMASSSPVTITGTNAADFSIGTNTCTPSLSIPVNGTCTDTATFTPSIVGNETATINFFNNVTGSPQSITITGVGLAQIIISPLSLNFNNVVVGTTSPELTDLVSNQGSTNATSLVLTLAGVNAASYSIDAITSSFSGSPNCALQSSIASGSSCTIGVYFAPTSAQCPSPTCSGMSSNVNISDSVPGSPQLVPLLGNAVAPSSLIQGFPLPPGWATLPW